MTRVTGISGMTRVTWVTRVTEKPRMTGVTWITRMPGITDRDVKLSKV